MLRQFIAGVIILISCLTYSSASKIDSLIIQLSEIEKIGTKAQQVQAYLDLADAYNEEYQHQKAVDVFVKAIDLSAEFADKTLYYKAHIDMGYTYFWMDDYRQALYHLKIVEGIKGAQISPGLKSLGLSRLAEVNINLGEFENAMETQLKVLRLSEIEGDSANIANSHRIIGRIHWYNQELNKALSSVKLAQWFYEQLNDKKSLYTCLASVAAIYTQLEEIENAYDATVQSLHLAESINYKYGIAFSTGMLGEIYKKKEEYGKAKDKFEIAIKSFRENQIMHESADFMKSLAENYALIGNYKLAISELNHALEIADGISAVLLQRDIYDMLGKYYEAAEEYENAYYYSQKYIYLNDSLFNSENRKRMENLSILHEIEKQSKEIEIIKEQHTASFNKLIAVGLGIGSILLSAILWLLYSRYKQQRINSSYLKRENSEMALKNQVLLNSNNYLRKVTDSLSQELRVTTRHLNEQANQLMDQRDQLQNHYVKRAVREVSAGVKRMDYLLSELFVASAEFDVPEKLNKINLRELVKEIVHDLPENYRGKGSQIMTQNLPDIIANKDKVRQLFQHLIINAIRFKRDIPAKVKIGCTYSNGVNIFSVQDNGRGFEPEEEELLFLDSPDLSSDRRYPSDRIGLFVCKMIVEQYKGKIWLSTEVGKGSTVFFTLPATTVLNPIQLDWLEEAS